MNYKRKSRCWFFLLMRSMTPPISSEFRGGFEPPKPPPRYATGNIRYFFDTRIIHLYSMVSPLHSLQTWTRLHCHIILQFVYLITVSNSSHSLALFKLEYSALWLLWILFPIRLAYFCHVSEFDHLQFSWMTTLRPLWGKQANVMTQHVISSGHLTCPLPGAHPL